MSEQSLYLTLNDIPVGMDVPFDNGMIGRKLSIEDYDRMTRYQSIEVEEGAVPFLVVQPNGDWLFILVPGENPVKLIAVFPETPSPFLDAFD